MAGGSVSALDGHLIQSGKPQQYVCIERHKLGSSVNNGWRIVSFVDSAV